MSELLVIALVGLPARGKSHMAEKLTRYFSWQSVRTEIFNVGNFRRKANAAANELQDASYFSSKNKEAEKFRNQLAMDVLNEVCEWLIGGLGQVAIFDATNTTFERRRMIYDKVVQQNGLKLFFLESICDDEDIVHSNVRNSKLGNEDYKKMDPNLAFDDFMKKAEMYEKRYEPLDEVLENIYSFVKIINVGKQIVTNRLQDSMQHKIVLYLSNLNIDHKSIYLCDKEQYTRNGFNKIANLLVWTPDQFTAFPCPIQSDHKHKKWAELNDAGSNVSNRDLAYRLEPLIIGLESSKTSIVVVASEDKLQCLLAYFDPKTCQVTSEYREVRL